MTKENTQIVSSFMFIGSYAPLLYAFIYMFASLYESVATVLNKKFLYSSPFSCTL